MDLFQNMIHQSRYARWRPDLGRRETWNETVTRYFDFFQDHLEAKHKYILTPSLRSELQEGVENFHFLPSMRALMTAGTALARCNVAGYNPVTGDTRVITQEYGLVEIRDLEGKTATVLNKDSRWTTATFRSYGTQPIVSVLLNYKGGQQKNVRCTRNHRWLLTDGNVLATDHLKVGDKVPFASAQRPAIDHLDYNLGVQHGIIYGDGTATYAQERLKGYHVRLCKDKDELLPFFASYPVCYPPSASGDPIVQMYGPFAKTHALKELPSADETDEYLVGFFRGWLATDGYVSAISQVALSCDDAGVNWLNRVASRLGYVAQRVTVLPSVTNFGKRNGECFSVYLDRASLSAEDFLTTRKRDLFRPNDNKHFTVQGVTETGVVEEVFCAEVPDTNTFVLEHGVVTGNCSYLPIDHLRSFDEALYIMMCGTGDGFSVERMYVNQLPTIAPTFERSFNEIYVADSKEGWADAFRQLLNHLVAGQIPTWNTSDVRPAGAPLVTFGGRASGPEPLEELFHFTVKMFQDAAARGLTSLECYDLLCREGEIVVVGGVRRVAQISLSDLDDDSIRTAKSGEWWVDHPYRALTNNSTAYKTKPPIGLFLKEWTSLYESQSGERGVFNRVAAQQQAARTGRREWEWEFGPNPCGEIILRPYQFCNLSESVCRDTDDYSTKKWKVQMATTIGTFQSTLVDFKYLRPVWKRNTEEERLLGVSLTGIMDSQVPHWSGQDLGRLKNATIRQNQSLAAELGIPPSAAITCVKPSGTVSQLVNSSSGIHARHSPYYIRTVRQDNKDPMTEFMKDQNFPNEPCVTKPNDTTIFSFPIKAPEGAVTRNEMTAIEQLELWLKFKTHWCEHSPSVTITVREHEWLEVGAWVFAHFDEISGVSFLPHSEHIYKQAPYQECTKEEYETMLERMPKEIDWRWMSVYEGNEDRTVGSQTLACTAQGCEI